MAGRFPPPPTYAEPIAIDEFGNAHFSVIWLQWFVDLTAPLGVDGTPSGVITDSILVNTTFGMRVATRFAQDALVMNDQSILMNQIFGP